MKNKIYFYSILLMVCAMQISVYAQSWTSGTNTLYTNPDGTKVGIGITSPTELLHVNNGALKIGNSTSATDRSLNLLKFGDGSYVQIGEWEADDLLSFKASKYNFTNGNVGINISTPQYKLDVNGKMYLRATEWINNTAYSYLHWQAHNLIMGAPANTYSVSRLYLKSGGSSEGTLYSEFKMFTAYSETNHVDKIKFNTEENSWINNSGYLGIGTDNPQCKLDVRGTLRANEILVNNVSGADFVFEEAYNLRPLSEVKEYVEKNKHLPEIQSAMDMQQNGVNISELQIQLLQKVEELTLYIIQQEKRIKELEIKVKK